MTKDHKPNEQSFLEHLGDLRKCLIGVVLALLFGFAGSLFISRELLRFITANAGKLVFLRPAEALMAQLKVALINGIVVSLPITLWRIGCFLWPAFYPRERKTLLFFLPFCFLLFCTGLGFGYFVVVRVGYEFLLSFASDTLQPMISLEKYISFVLSSILICGTIFMLPIVILILNRIGILKASFLRRQQKLIIIGLMALVAILTPTVDAVSMILVFLPLLFLFELSVLLASISERRKAKRIADSI